MPAGEIDTRYGDKMRSAKKQNGPKRGRLFNVQMVERTRIELVTPTMSTWCSPAELTLH